MEQWPTTHGVMLYDAALQCFARIRSEYEKYQKNLLPLKICSLRGEWIVWVLRRGHR
jgi:hypothetical protein